MRLPLHSSLLEQAWWKIALVAPVGHAPTSSVFGHRSLPVLFPITQICTCTWRAAAAEKRMKHA